MTPSDLPAARAARRARSLAELEATLDRCTRLLDEATARCEQVTRLEEQIVRVRRDIDRLRGVGSFFPVDPHEEAALGYELMRVGGLRSPLGDQDNDARIDGARPPPNARNPSLR